MLTSFFIFTDTNRTFVTNLENLSCLKRPYYLDTLNLVVGQNTLVD